MLFDVLVQTAVRIIRERNPASSEHRGANLALKVRTVESMLELGMVAEACEIVVRFIRFLDKSCFDISALPSHIQALNAAATLNALRHVLDTLRLHSAHVGLDPQATTGRVDKRLADKARGHQRTILQNCDHLLAPNLEMVEVG